MKHDNGTRAGREAFVAECWTVPQWLFRIFWRIAQVNGVTTVGPMLNERHVAYAKWFFILVRSKRETRAHF
jgi:hypothetical protein